MNDEELRKNIYLLQRHQEEIENTYAQIDVIERMINEYRRTIETLQEMASMEEGKEILMPIGGNVFAYTTLKNTKKVILSIGDKVFIEKSTNGAIDFLNKKIEELMKSEEKLINLAEELSDRMNEISKKIKKEDVPVS
ncbi:MAG: prefoldin subunit alpha [Thermoplasmatales archaeon]|nr:prefoldin subunit alpha [Thermoplasmatales archaeon]